MAGLSMACALGSLPICKDLSIGLVEGNEPINYGNNSEDWSDPPKLPEIPELRVSAISTGNINFFKSTFCRSITCPITLNITSSLPSTSYWCMG